MADKIDEILKQRQAAEKPAELKPDADKFYSILIGEGLQDNFLELQFRNGLQTCFNYTDLLWFNHDPESGCIDLEIGGFLITIKGRGLRPLFQAIKNKRVGWVKEADSGLQDHKDNDCFIEEISIVPPKGFAEETQADDQA